MELERIETLLTKMGYSREDIELVKKAYTYAYNLHKGQFRESGEPYISHPVSVFYILLEMKVDRDTLCAGILHDVVEDTNMTKEDIEQLFNKDVAMLVDGVTKISGINFTSKQAKNLANWRKIVATINKDIRIIIIKLADRLHNMRTLKYKKRPKQIENSLETLELYVPLAHRIGLYRIKSELEDLSFRYLEPDTYQEILERKMRLDETNNSCMIETSKEIKELLHRENISNEIKIRTKNIYGIYNRLKEGYKKLEDIHDLLSLKIMVNELENCYQGLNLITEKYQTLDDKFKDYIINPKNNMYQSLHATIKGEYNRLVQTQIRTFEMDRIASFGLAAYWDINQIQAKDMMQEDFKNTSIYKALVQVNKTHPGNQEFVNQMKFEISRAYPDNQEFINNVKMKLYENNVYVFTPKGDTIELPKGANPIDFAYLIHTDIGNRMTKAEVNGNSVSIDYVLQNNDTVNIVIDSNKQHQDREWINVAYTPYAKRKIKEYR